MEDYWENLERCESLDLSDEDHKYFVYVYIQKIHDALREGWLDELLGKPFFLNLYQGRTRSYFFKHNGVDFVILCDHRGVTHNYVSNEKNPWFLPKEVSARLRKAFLEFVGHLEENYDIQKAAREEALQD